MPTLRWEWLLAALVLAAAASIAFAPVADILTSQWSTNDTYSFGVLVPFISGYFVWLQRERLKQIPVEPSPLIGMVLVAGCALLFAVGRTVGVVGVQEIAMVLMLPASLWLLCGRRLVFALWFPLLYLFLMLPIWEILTDRFHYRSQLFSAEVGQRLLWLAGIPVLRRDTYLELPNITLEVASVCSGVNFLIAVIAIGVPQAYLFLQGLRPRAMVMGFALAIALFSNGLRIAIIGLLSHYEWTRSIHGPGHLLQGLFASALGLIALQVAIAVLRRRYPRPPGRAVEPPASPSTDRRVLVPATVAAVAVIGAAVFQPRAALANTSEPLVIDVATGWSILDPEAPMQFVEGGSERNVGRLYATTLGSPVEVFAGSLAYTEPEGGLGYRRLELPTTSATSEMPVKTARGLVFVNRVAFVDDGKTTDVAFWFDTRPSVTSQITSAKLSTLWAVLSGAERLPRLVVIRRQRVATADEPFDGLVAQVIDALDAESKAPSGSGS